MLSLTDISLEKINFTPTLNNGGHLKILSVNKEQFDDIFSLSKSPYAILLQTNSNILLQ